VLVNSAGAAQRTPTPEEVVHAVLFLALSKASYVTGICMRMDGALYPIVV
jgi:NAD(P)-dependent dehydrogenase (short-subunit alcohol dehydrogenase family)